MEFAIDTQRRTTWSHWSAPTVAALAFTYMWLWLLTYGLVHMPKIDWLPLDVVLESPPPSAEPPAPAAPPKPVKNVPPPAAPPKLLTQKPVAAPAESAVPAPPLDAPPNPQTTAEPALEPALSETATQPVLQTPRLETIPVSRLTRTPAFVHKVVPEDPANVQMPLNGVRIVARITLDETAAVRDVEIVKSGGAAFDTAVIAAIRRSRFTPGYIDDRPVATAFNQSYRFQLQ